MAEVKTQKSNDRVQIETENGDIVLRLFPETAPNHVASFKRLASEGFYDGMYFHRVIKGFMAQGGDPTLVGKPAPDFSLDAEFSDIPFDRGILGAARLGHDVNSASTQFFIMFAPAHHLNGDYTAFGEVIEGMDVVDKIQKADKMLKVTVLE